MSAISEKFNPNRLPRESFGLKAESILNRITLNPSSANLGEKLYLNIPKLLENKVIVPGSVYLRFDLNVEGHANNILVNNVSRNLASELKVTFGVLEVKHRKSQGDMICLRRMKICSQIGKIN